MISSKSNNTQKNIQQKVGNKHTPMLLHWLVGKYEKPFHYILKGTSLEGNTISTRNFRTVLGQNIKNSTFHDTIKDRKKFQVIFRMCGHHVFIYCFELKYVKNLTFLNHQEHKIITEPEDLLMPSVPLMGVMNSSNPLKYISQETWTENWAAKNTCHFSWPWYHHQR